MLVLYRYLLGLSLLFSPVFIFAQSLQVGGQLGGNTVLMPADEHLQQAGSQGQVFVTYQRPKWRAGVQIGFRYTRWHDSTSVNPQASIPLQARIALDQKGLVHVFAGPYVGIGRERSSKKARQAFRKIHWGLSTGLDIRIPLSRRMVLVSAAQLDQAISDSTGAPQPNQTFLAPKRMLVFSLHLGLAYWFRNRK